MTDHPTDDELLAMLAEQQAPMPQRLVDDAKALFTWRTVDQEIAELLSDSNELTAAVRSTSSAVRHLEFGSTDRGMRIDHLSDEQTMLGQVIGLDATSVTAQWADGTTEQAQVDDARFQLAARPGSVRFVASADGVDLLVTEWITLG